mmetsp:Transcript_3280/g.6506  ORF Transcript_3280/g.6506 Transcript_3280/m.6506 type:complete len:447 (-) Transcript_3280:263-1603(-)
MASLTGSTKNPALLHTRMDHVNSSLEREKALLSSLSSYLGTRYDSQAGTESADTADYVDSPTTNTDYSTIAKQLEREGPIEYTDLKMKLQFDQQVEVWVDSLSGIETSCTDRDSRFLFLFEPEEITQMRSMVIAKASEFRRVFSHDPVTIAQIPNGDLFQHGGTWILPSAIATYRDLISSDRLIQLLGEEWHGSTAPGAAAKWVHRPKRLAVSFVCGAKRVTLGHRIRKALWEYQAHILMQTCFFFSGVQTDCSDFLTNLVLPSSPVAKLLLFDVQFHIAIENIVQDDYFTEKILDCFLTCTVPVYVGCPNIGKYFDIEGIIHVGNFETQVKDNDDSEICEETASRIVAALNLMKPESYSCRLNAITKNFFLAHRFVNQRERMESAILGMLDNSRSLNGPQLSSLSDGGSQKVLLSTSVDIGGPAQSNMAKNEDELSLESPIDEVE